MLPIKQPPPGRSYPSTVGVGVLSAAEQFEMQAAFAYTAALAKQVPVPKGLYAYNLARAKALLPPGLERWALNKGNYFSVTQFVGILPFPSLTALQEQSQASLQKREAQGTFN